MTESLFDHVVVPVASEEDATTTMRAALPHLESSGGSAVLVHVIEKAGGAPDKASVEQREENAQRIFDAGRDVADGSTVDVDCQIVYGKDVARTIVDAAVDRDVSAIVFTPRGGSRWARVLSGDVTHELLSESTLPVITLPDDPS